MCDYFIDLRLDFIHRFKLSKRRGGDIRCVYTAKKSLKCLRDDNAIMFCVVVMQA